MHKPYNIFSEKGKKEENELKNIYLFGQSKRKEREKEKRVHVFCNYRHETADVKSWNTGQGLFKKLTLFSILIDFYHIISGQFSAITNDPRILSNKNFKL